MPVEVPYNYNRIEERIRTMGTIHTATHVLPQLKGACPVPGSCTGIKLEYAGTLPAAKFISVVDASLNGGNPCVNPAVAGAAQSTTTSGKLTAASGKKEVVVPQHTHYLDATKIMTVCYAETDGSATDITWRDSYIHLRMSKVSSIISYQVEHFTTGQIPHHAELKIDYLGSLEEKRHLLLVDAQHSKTTMGALDYEMPCAAASAAAGAKDTSHSGYGTGGDYYTCAAYGYTVQTTPVNLCDVNHDGVYDETCGADVRCDPTNPDNGGCGTIGVCAGKRTVTVDTTTLSITNMGTGWVTNGDAGVNNAERYYAVCYADAVTASNTVPWYDTGIRVTIPEVINMVADSGYYTHTEDAQTKFGGTDTGGTPVRNQYSWAQKSGMALVDTPTNRLPQGYESQSVWQSMYLTYIAQDTTQFGTSKYFALVATTVNSGNPCVRATDPTASADTLHSGALQAEDLPIGGENSNKKGRTIAIPQGGASKQLDATKEFTVCYSIGDGSDDVTDSKWRDSYVRLKISKVESLTTYAVTHVTTGMVPNVKMIDKMKFTYRGSLPNGKYLALVDASLQNGLPCVGSEAGKTRPGDDSVYASWAHRSTHTGAHSNTGQKFIVTFSTYHLDTSKTFAVCYSDGTGTNTDTLWADSGLRVTVPKVRAVTYESGAIGPDTKLDTQPRIMTSVPYDTNRLPQAENMKLTYVGDLPAGKHISLVDITVAGNRQYEHTRKNPCVYPYAAAAPSTNEHPHNGFNAGSTSFSGVTTAPAGTKEATISQAPLSNRALANKNLDGSQAEFAVCYAEGDGKLFAPQCVHSNPDNT
jgi:hypothetical protein